MLIKANTYATAAAAVLFDGVRPWYVCSTADADSGAAPPPGVEESCAVETTRVSLHTGALIAALRVRQLVFILVFFFFFIPCHFQYLRRVSSHYTRRTRTHAHTHHHCHPVTVLFSLLFFLTISFLLKTFLTRARAPCHRYISLADKTNDLRRRF